MTNGDVPSRSASFIQKARVHSYSICHPAPGALQRPTQPQWDRPPFCSVLKMISTHEISWGGGSCKLAHPFVEHLPFVYLPCLCARTRDARLHLCTSMRALHVSVFSVSSC